MNVLLTGASGFIGRRVVARLMNRSGVRVQTLGRSPSSSAGVKHLQCDLMKADEIASAVRSARATHLIHLAWTAKPGLFWTNPENLSWSSATIELVRVFAESGGQAAVLAGSCAEYDLQCSGRFAEDAEARPDTLYGVAKDATRRVVCRFGVEVSMPVAWARIFWPYGPGEPRGRLVSDLAHGLLTGVPVSLGDGEERRDFIYVDDVADAILAALDARWHGPLNIGSGGAVSVRKVAETMAALCGRHDLLWFGARAGPASKADLIEADVRLLRRQLGFRARHTLEDGLRATLRHAGAASI